MSGAGALDRLAARYGIVASYHDIWGAAHAASAETKRALLRTMGVVADNEEAAEASLRALEEAECARMLPPVVVCSTSGRCSVPVWCAERDGSDLRWTIGAETGERWEGTGAPQATDRRASPTGPRALRTLEFDAAPFPIGYHSLNVTGPDGERDSSTLIVTPDTCYGIEDAVGDARVWGIAAQLYGLRSDRNWGIGDYADLGDLAAAGAGKGAAAIGINPVHAGFAADPHHFSPYSPSSRIFLNHLNIDLTAVPEFADCPQTRELMASEQVCRALATARAADLVDYAAVSAAKLPVLEALHRRFIEAASADRKRAFATFRAEWGNSLERHAIFEALHAHFFGTDMHLWSWRTWPEPYRDCGSAEVAAFATEHADRVDFFAWLQWIADLQLGDAHRRAREAGMPIGVYRDLAVASDGGGSMAWSWPHVVLAGASVGAPPDDLGPMGQNWGLSPLSPQGLRETAYVPFIHALRANMRHAGALRIDHVMALTRLFWIPPGMTGRDGAYVQYPFEDLIRIVALESRRHRCVVIGEDLGTLPAGFPETLQRFGVLSYRIMSFERNDDGGLKQPAQYPERALVAVATHDMPTVRGLWVGRDIDWRGRVVEGISPEWVDSSHADRKRTRQSTIAALRDAGLDPGDDAADQPTPGLAEAVHRFIARTPSRLLMVQLEDLLDLDEQANLPGTSSEHPNWQRRLPCTVGELFSHPHAGRIIAALNEDRRR